ncbi:hypothetical protein [Kushneria sp. EE4]
MSFFTFRLRHVCCYLATWLAHQLVALRILPAGLALVAIALVLVTIPLLYTHQLLAAALCVMSYRLMSVLSGCVSKALGHSDARQRYLRPFMEVILILSVMAGLSLSSPERLLWPALALVVVVLVFDLERRLVVLLQKAQGIVAREGHLERVIDVITGSAGRTLLLIAACYRPQSFFWSGFAFAGLCCLVLVWRLVSNYRRLKISTEPPASPMPVDREAPVEVSTSQPRA